MLTVLVNFTPRSRTKILFFPLRPLRPSRLCEINSRETAPQAPTKGLDRQKAKGHSAAPDTLKELGIKD